MLELACGIITQRANLVSVSFLSARVETSGWLCLLLGKAETNFVSAPQMGCSLVFSLPHLQLKAVTPQE